LGHTSAEASQQSPEWPMGIKEHDFERVVRENQRLVFSLAFHFLGNRETAEELAQDVFVQLYHHLGSISSPLHLRAWLRRVTVHRCIDAARRGSRLRLVSLDEAVMPAATPAAPDPLATRALARMIRSLPAKSRLVVILRYQEELELREIAEIMELPLNTVKSSLQRALALLRAKLTRTTSGVSV
jgi:RNA polymerase sigma-70 factor, ECF subfamily